MNKLSFICPFCYEEIRTADVQHRCTTQTCPSYGEADAELKAYTGRPVNLGHVVVGQQKKGLFGFRKQTGSTCDVCGGPTIQICPRCHNRIPDSSLEGEDNIISIIGTRASGKSHYITVLIDRLRRYVAPDLGASLTTFNDRCGLYDAGQLYRDTKYKKLFEDQQTLDLTAREIAGQALSDEKWPLIYSFDYVKPMRGRSDHFTLSFLDAAGEDLEDAAQVATFNRYVGHSSGIIFLVDPLQFPEVLAEVEATMGAKSTSTGGVQGRSPDEVLSNITEQIRLSMGLKRGEPINIPVAVAFSKFDALAPIAEDAQSALSTSPHSMSGMFMEADCKNVDAEIRSLLYEWGQAAFITQMEANYSKFGFFAVSSLGLENAPDENGRVRRPNPHRIEDPLLWVMAQNNLVQTQRVQ